LILQLTEITVDFDTDYSTGVSESVRLEEEKSLNNA
jgi:hypothetical protein